MPQDPNAPWAWIPPEWDAPLVGTAFGVPDALVPPAPDPGVAVAPVATPFSQAYDDEESRSAPNPVMDRERGTYVNEAGDTIFPYGGAPATAPRTDVARIAQATGPIGTVGQIGKDVDPNARQQPAISELPTFTPDELAQVGQAPPPFIGRPRPDLGTMPDDFVGGAGNLGFTEMPEDFAGRELGPQDPYPDVATGPGADLGRVLGAVPGAVGQLANDAGNALTSQDTRAPEEPEEYLTDDELAQKYTDEATRDPEAFAKRLVDHQQKRKVVEENARLRAIEEDNDRRKANFAAEQQARERAARSSAELDTEAQRLAQTDITDDAWMNSRSPMQKVAAFASAILGGLASGSTGGRNMGLEAIQNLIARHTENLRANLVNKRALLGDRRNSIEAQYARDMEASKAAEVERQAMYAAAIRKLEIEGEQYDPRGTTALRKAQAIAGLRAQAAEAKAKWQEEDYKRGLELAKFGLEQDKHLLEVAKARPDIALKMQKLAAAGMGGGAKRPPEYFKALGLPVPPWAMTDKEHAAWMAHSKTAKELGGNDAKGRKEEADAAKAEAEANAAKSGFAIANPETGTPFVNKDGSPFVVMDTEERKRLRGITTAAVNIRRLADKIEAVREKTGGGSKTLGTDDYQELESLAKAVDFETYKAFDLGAPSAGDQAMAQGIKGGVDITSFLKDPKKGLRTYADSVEKKALAHLRGAGYTGPALHFHRASDLEKSEPSVVDTVLARLTTAPAADVHLGGGIGAVNIDPKVAQTFGANGVKSEEVRDAENDLTILAAYAEQPKTAAEARAGLEQLATRGISARVRARAKEILDGLPGAGERKEGAR